jgi:hypothetical protein
MITIATIKARRDQLVAQLEAGKAQHEQLDRQLCALAGRIAELAELIDQADPRDPTDVQESRLGEAHQTIDVAQQAATAAGAWNDAIWKAKREHMDSAEEHSNGDTL